MDDDLTRIPFIGPKRAGELAAMGIATFAELATADAAFLAQTMEVRPEMIAHWQQVAAELAPEEIAFGDGDGVTEAAVGFELIPHDVLLEQMGQTAVYEHLLTGRVKR